MRFMEQLFQKPPWKSKLETMENNKTTMIHFVLVEPLPVINLMILLQQFSSV
jgi:hypothetical protein